MATTEQILLRIEKKLDTLLTTAAPQWISEKDAMQLIGRSSTWLRRARMGSGGVPATLAEGTD